MYVSNEKIAQVVAQVLNKLASMTESKFQKQPTDQPSQTNYYNTFNPSGWQTDQAQPDNVVWGSNSASNTKKDFTNSKNQETYQGHLFQGSVVREKIKAAYKILNLHEGSSLDEVISAYRLLAKQYHPDKVANLAQEFRDLPETKQKEINEAYSFLRSHLT
jgi:DnaJ-domain-containing protein 1